MALRTLRRLGYGWLVVQGLLAALVPRLHVKLNLAMWRTGFDGLGEVEPKAWVRRAVRACGLGMMVAGLVGLALEGRAAERAAAEEAAAQEKEAAEAAEAGELDDVDSATDRDD